MYELGPSEARFPLSLGQRVAGGLGEPKGCEAVSMFYSFWFLNDVHVFFFP